MMKVASFRVLRTHIHAVEIEDVTKMFELWISHRERSHYVTVCNVHVVMEAYNNDVFREVLSSADLAVPDGMPLVWVGRRRGFPLRKRVYGPDLFLEFCRTTASKGYRHFLYGGHLGVPELVASKLKDQCPGLQIAGTYSPPFRAHSAGEQREVIDQINGSGTDVLWVALGCPKQELWMYQNRNRLKVPVIVGVGQAFDIVAERVRQAPVWARNRGLEWAFRLANEPRRLWHRYLVYNTQFVYYSVLELLGLIEPQSSPPTLSNTR